MTMRVKKSAIIAFLELLKSMEDGDDVLLLRSSDLSAKKALQDYSDYINDEGIPPHAYTDRWILFVEKLAEKFHTDPESAYLSPDIPEQNTMQYLCNVLNCARKRILSPSD